MVFFEIISCCVSLGIKKVLSFFIFLESSKKKETHINSESIEGFRNSNGRIILRHSVQRNRPLNFTRSVLRIWNLFSTKLQIDVERHDWL